MLRGKLPRQGYEYQQTWNWTGRNLSEGNVPYDTSETLGLSRFPTRAPLEEYFENCSVTGLRGVTRSTNVPRLPNEGFAASTSSVALIALALRPAGEFSL